MYNAKQYAEAFAQALVDFRKSNGGFDLYSFETGELGSKVAQRAVIQQLDGQFGFIENDKGDYIITTGAKSVAIRYDYALDQGGWRGPWLGETSPIAPYRVVEL
jgi:hypothetical protein